MKTLDQLSIGQRAIITEISLSHFRNKLIELGCIPGTLVEKKYKAPFGDPVAFSIGGYLLSMRKEQAETIIVELEKDD